MIRSLIRLAVLALFLSGSAAPGYAETADFLRLARQVASLGADVADDVPATSIQRGLKRVDPSDGLSKLPDGAALRAVLKTADPALLRQFEALSPEDAATVLRLFEGAEALKASPDALSRARAMMLGGSDLILSAGRYGDEMTTPAFRLLAAEDVGQLPAGTLQKFSETVATRGKVVLKAWNRHILPNWKKLAAAGVLADVVFNDGEWITEAGELTTEAMKTLVGIGADIVVDTAVEVPKQIVKSIWEKLWSADGPWVLLIGTVVALPLAVWLSRVIRGGVRILVKIWQPSGRNPLLDKTSTAVKPRSRLAARSFHGAKKK